MGKRSRHKRTEHVIARETPDEISLVFDLKEASFRRKLSQWLLKYQRLMRIKHGSDVVVDVRYEGVPGEATCRAITVYVKQDEDVPAPV